MARILLVDDSEANRDMLSRRLQRKGHHVVVAADGRRAVDMVRAEPPDVVLMDLNLPVLDGWSATREIKAMPEARHVPVIALTAHAMSGDRQRALDAGCDDYEAKPIDFPRLLSKIDAHCVAVVVAAERATPAPHPSREQPAAPPTAKEARDSAVQGARVLVVDDTEANRDLLTSWLRRRGFEAEAAADGASAIELIDRTAYDAVLLDVMMPGISGLDVLRAVRHKHPATELPIIMATARNATGDVVEALELGANDYVVKPLDFPMVLARLRTQVTLKRAVQQTIELERDLERRNRDLQAANARMSQDLAAAAKVQASLLPARDPGIPGYRCAWSFRPSAWIGGDIFNVFSLDDGRAGLYVLDVSGHGVAAALLSVTISRFLSPVPDPSSLLWQGRAEGPTRFVPESPPRVAERLSERFPFDERTRQFFTLFYGILDTRTHELSYTSAGHPNVLHVPQEGPATVLEAAGYPIGVGPGEYETYAAKLLPGDRFYIHSDGITEAQNPEGEWFGVKRLLDTLEAMRSEPLDATLRHLSSRLEVWTGRKDIADDQTVLAMERWT